MIAKHRAFYLSGLCLLAAGASDAQSWLETRIEVEELVEQGEFAAAAVLGDTLLEEVRETFGNISDQLAESHLLLASIQTRNQDFLDAEGNVLEAIDIYEVSDGPLSTKLIAPYIVLGETYHAAAEYELALNAYDQARDVGRRAYGLLNDGQIEILDRMSRTALSMGDFDEAKEFQLEAVTLVQRSYGDDSLEYLDANYRYADWLRTLRSYADAERTYFAMHRIIERNFDDDPVLTIGLLRTQAANQRDAVANVRYFRSPMLQTPGLSGTAPRDLEDALKIVRDLDEPNPALHAAILVDIGDWNVAYGNMEDIAAPYLEAWNILDEIGGGAQLQLEWFSEQIVVYSAPLLSGLLVVDPQAPWGEVDVSFIIDSFGRTNEVRIISADPPGLIDGAAARQILNSRFRPRINDGRLVASPGRFTWRFQYDDGAATRFSDNSF